MWGQSTAKWSDTRHDVAGISELVASLKTFFVVF